VGGSVSIAALIVGTTLLGIFALASLSLSDSARTASDVLEEIPREPDFRLLNASSGGGLIHLNVTNVGVETISFEQAWFSVDGGTPLRLSDYHSITTVLFPGETIHLQITHGAISPSRIFVASMGAQSGVAFS
jgi:archaellum component FlaG (FlaF/FlaG flagellin family)|tara:strand:+ start:1121 stop:1519 length:399 start_codon:yes stop_codon:yes gene_type:complete